jgi:hypothetical protein
MQDEVHKANAKPAKGPRPSAGARLLGLSDSNKKVLAEAVASLAAASLSIRLLPFRRTAAIMGNGAPIRPLNDAARDRLVAQCRWAVDRWADRVPWRAVCFQRGLALHMMLRRRGIASVLHYGVAQDGAKGLRAHVWVSVGGRTVMGGADAPDYACVASFPAATQA